MTESSSDTTDVESEDTAVSVHLDGGLVVFAHKLHNSGKLAEYLQSDQCKKNAKSV